MALTLKTIRFNHNVNESRTSAFNIRKNKEVEILVPEFDAERPRPIAYSTAAYSVLETSGQRLFINVGFTADPGQAASYEIQALDGGVLGSLSGNVTFTASQMQETQIELVLNNRDFAKVGRFDISWVWQFRRNANEAWQTFATTAHRIYLTFSIPAEPFVQIPFDRRNPWTELLDHSCNIVQGIQTQEEATEALAKALYLNYNLLYTGQPSYSTTGAAADFNLSNWIRYVLNRDIPAGFPVRCMGTAYNRPACLWVNCYDMGASLCLMSKSVGVQISYYYHAPFGFLNPLIPIGRELTNSASTCERSIVYDLDETDAPVPLRPYRGSFGNHAYTKMREDKIYDACMLEGVSPFRAIALYLATMILFLITFGALFRRDWLNQAGGWLFNLDQATYESKIIDRSTATERSVSRGMPARQAIGFLTN